MPVQLHGSEYYDAITDDVIAAWVIPDTIFYGKPKSGPNVTAYAVIRLASVPMDWAGVRTIEQTYSFVIAYRAPWPDDDDDWNIEIAKEQKANALLAQLSTGALYNGTGLMPLVTGVEFDESDDPEDRYYEVTVTFEVTRHEGA